MGWLGFLWKGMEWNGMAWQDWNVLELIGLGGKEFKWVRMMWNMMDYSGVGLGGLEWAKIS